jgi:O-antigen/teichoic acid export membrane protein
MVFQFLGLAVSGLLGRVALLVVGVLVARHFGPAQFGSYASAFAFASMFLLAANIGSSFRLMRLAAVRDPGLRVAYGNTLLVSLTLAVFLSAIMVLVVKSMGYAEGTRRLVYLLGPVILLSGLHEVFSAVYQGFERMGAIAVFRGIHGVVLLGCMGIVVVTDASLETYCVLAFSGVGGVTVMWLWATSAMVRPRVAVAGMGKLLRESYLYGLSGLFLAIYFRIDTVMLSVMRSTTDVAEYNAAYQLLEIFIKVSVLASFVTMPRSFAVAGRKEQLAAIYELKTRYLGVIGAVLAIWLYFFADEMMRLTVGGQYETAPAALKVLALVTVPKFLAVAAGDVLTAVDRQGTRTAIQGGIALANVALNLVLIPYYGLFGAAWAKVLSELLLIAFYYAAVARIDFASGVWRGGARAVVCLAASALLGLAVAQGAGHIVGGVVASLSMGILAWSVGLLRWRSLPVGAAGT